MKESALSRRGDYPDFFRIWDCSPYDAFLKIILEPHRLFPAISIEESLEARFQTAFARLGIQSYWYPGWQNPENAEFCDCIDACLEKFLSDQLPVSRANATKWLVIMRVFGNMESCHPILAKKLTENFVMLIGQAAAFPEIILRNDLLIAIESVLFSVASQDEALSAWAADKLRAQPYLYKWHAERLYFLGVRKGYDDRMTALLPKIILAYHETLDEIRAGVAEIGSDSDPEIGQALMMALTQEELDMRELVRRVWRHQFTAGKLVDPDLGPVNDLGAYHASLNTVLCGLSP